MKKLTIFFVSFFLFSFTGVTLAANIKVEDASTTDIKSVVVSVDTGTETTGNIKAVIEHSEDVTITEVTESDVSCSTFSHVSSDNRTEIICTLSTNKVVKGIIAEIRFTSDSEDYQFKIIREETIIGDLKIEKISNMGSEDVLDASTGLDMLDEETEPSQITTDQAVPTTTKNPVTTPTKETNIMKTYLPYILIGIAGIAFVTLVILWLTRKKDDVVLTDLPASAVASTTPTEPQPTTQPQQPVNFDNIPENLQNETMHDNIPTQKPTLEEIVNQSATDTGEIPTTELAEPTTPTTVGTSEQADLEALLQSEGLENSSLPSSGVTVQTEELIQPEPVVPVDNPITNDISQAEPTVTGDTPQIGETNISQTTIQPLDTTQPESSITEINTPVSTEPTTTPIDNTALDSNNSLDNYTANISEGGLPTIGSEPSIADTSTNLISPNLGPIEQEPQVNPTVTTQPVETSIDNDLQNMINEEINGMANSIGDSTSENTPTTQM